MLRWAEGCKEVSKRHYHLDRCTHTPHLYVAKLSSHSCVVAAWGASMKAFRRTDQDITTGLVLLVLVFGDDGWLLGVEAVGLPRGPEPAVG